MTVATSLRHDAERKHRALRHIAALYGQHGDSRSSLVAVHAAVWADIFAAHAADPSFDEAAAHAAAVADSREDTYEGYGPEHWQQLWRYLIHECLTPDAAGRWLEMVGEPVPIAGIPAPPKEGLDGNPFGEPGESREDSIVRLRGEVSQLTQRLYADTARGGTREAERDSEAADGAAFQLFLLERSLRRGDGGSVQAEILWALADVAQSAAADSAAGDDVRRRVMRRRAAQVWALPISDQPQMLASFPDNPLL